MTYHIAPDVRQHDTHEELVGQADSRVAPPLSRPLDAIIVPASRPARHLDHAAMLAEATRSRLLILCSRRARSDDLRPLLAARSLTEAMAVDLHPRYRHPWLRFDTSNPQKIGRLPQPCAARDSDLSMKRNIGLIVARMLGWDRVFFMDDDITNIAADDLHQTVSMLDGKYYSVGMRVTDFPDNSVVCHARRATGMFQDVMVTGSVLAVDCTASIGFFPDVYNEDWLFFYDDAAEHRLGTSGFEAKQLRYDPFDRPRRAARQEFGDVLAEGLYALLHRGQTFTSATQDYWINFLDARRGLLEAIIARPGRAPAKSRQKLLNSVQAARKCSEEIEPEFCEHYVRLWRKDLGRWQQTLKELPRVSSMAEALSELGLERSDDHDAGRSAPRIYSDLRATSALEGEFVQSATGPEPIPTYLAKAFLQRRVVLLSSGRTAAASDTADLGTAIETADRGQKLTAVGAPLLLVAAFLASYLAVTASLVTSGSWRGRYLRARGGAPQWVQRSRRMIAAGRQAARELSGHIDWPLRTTGTPTGSSW